MCSERIAGHVFAGIGSDQRCTECGRWWTEIKDCDDSHIGKRDLAHAGELNYAELSEIRAKNRKEDRAWDLVAEVSNGARRDETSQ